MGSIVGATKMHHTVKTGERSAVALVAMRIEFLLREDITTRLGRGQ